MKTLYPLRPKITVNNNFYVFDTETGTKKGKKIKWELEARPEKFIFGAVYGYNFTKVFYSRADMVNEFKDRRYKGCKVFAHNFGRYDGSVLFDNIFDMDAEAIYIGSRFISATNGNCIFADSLNIYKASVNEIGKKLGLPKTMQYNDSLWPRDKSRDTNACVRDCQIIWDALLEIFEEAGDIKLTIGSLAMTYYRRFAQPYYIESNENTKHFWKSYYGGRTEAFQLGVTHAKVIDVNSMYPFAMKKCVYPNPKYLKHEKSTNVDRFLTEILPHFEGCVSCSVLHPDIYIGLLPSRIGGKLVFPIGRFSGCWNFNELRFAISNGVTIETLQNFTFAEKMVSPFEKFVDNLYQGKFLAKVEGRALDEWKYKYLLNNLYGKFGQRIDEKTIYLKDIVEQYDLIKEHQRNKTFIKLIPFNDERQDAFMIVKETRKIEIAYSIPSFSSYITSYGRVMLAKKLLEMKKNRPVYCDTDSIFFEIENNVESSDILGEWKIEEKTVTQINGLKNYKYEYWDKETKSVKKVTRIKGVPSKAIEVKNNSFEFTSLIGTKEGLRRSLPIGSPSKRTKVIKGTYDKREVLKSGKTKPIKL